MTVGLVGYGRFGRLAASLIAPHTGLVVFDPGLKRKPSGPPALRRGTLADAAGQPLVILAVPVSSLEPLLRRIRGLVMPGALVADVCAVKAAPVRWMKRILPGSVEILGTHPMFGPDSCSGSLAGHSIHLCPVRGTRWKVTAALLQEAGLTVHVTDPDRHDRLMAETVFLTQCVGRLVNAAGFQEHEEGTVHYRQLRSIARVAGNDTVGLFRDMWLYNVHARRAARRLGAGWERINRLLAGRDPAGQAP